MRRPVIFIGVTVVVLLALGAPFLRIAFGGVDARVLPEGTPSRMVSEALQRDFAGAATSPVEVVLTGADRGDVDSYVGALQDVPGVTSAAVTGAAGDTTRISLGYSGQANDDAAQDIVAAVRDVPAPSGADVLVGGETAALVDLLDGLGNTLPWMALFVVAVTGVLLFFAFGSVVLPVKAVVMNALSLAATFGVIVWIFQDGNLSGLLGFTATGTIEATQPILILALAFGLSMDYEVFLLSRIREQWDRTGDNTQAVATGLQRSGQIITSAALLLVVVIGAFSTSGITFIKMIGLGMVVAIVIDATIVRALLVPATMRLLGRANWYAPKPLLRVYDRFGFSETEEIALDDDRADAVPDRVLV
jgi:RND superfamily putative drug exporter